LCALLKQLPLYSYKVDYFLDKNFASDNLQSKFTRSVFQFGKPLVGYVDDMDREEEQQDAINKYFLDELYVHLLPISVEIANGKSPAEGEVKFLLLMTGTIFDIIIGIVIQDCLLAVMAILMVWAFLWLQTGSCFIASMGMAEILLSLPTGYFLFRGIFQIKFFGFLNALTLFLVLAIGADDIFVFMDAYKQSATKGPLVNKNLSTRMTWVYKRAGLAMLITSATTCAAFLCTCISPLASTIAFGVFAALVILCDYILVMTFFCTTVVIYHNSVEVRQTCGCEKNRTGCCACVCCFPVPPTERTTATQGSMPLTEAEGHQTVYGLCASFKIADALSLIFGAKIGETILNARARICIGVVFAALLIPMATLASKIKPTEQAEQFLPDTHPFQAIINVFGNEFPSSGESSNTWIYASWGLGKVDRDGVAQLYNGADNIGTGTFDEKFEFNAPMQQHILQSCTEVTDYGIDGEPKYPDMVRVNSETGKFSVECWVYDLYQYIQEGRRLLLADPTDAQSRGYMLSSYVFPIPDAQIPAVMNEFMSTEAAGSQSTILDKYTWKLGWDKQQQKVRFVTFGMESQHINQHAFLTRAAGLKEYVKFEAFVSDQNKRGSDAGLTAEMFQSDMAEGDVGKWNFMENQKIYTDSAISGAIAGVLLAFVVILLATRSLIVATTATVSITGTLVCVLGCMQLQGWQLGTIEAILISITAGFSVDYVVHLAHAYVQKVDASREDRVLEAFEEMGMSVFSGMATSFMAAFVLLFCQLQFFFKFGVFLAATITFSWLWANLFFMSVMAQFGPEATTVRMSSSLGQSKTSAEPQQKVLTEMEVVQGTASSEVV
jgi:hypothetical protein